MFYDRVGTKGRVTGKILRCAQDDRGAKDDNDKETLWRELHLIPGHFKKY